MLLENFRIEQNKFKVLLGLFVVSLVIAGILIAIFVPRAVPKEEEVVSNCSSSSDCSKGGECKNGNCDYKGCPAGCGGGFYCLADRCREVDPVVLNDCKGKSPNYEPLFWTTVAVLAAWPLLWLLAYFNSWEIVGAFSLFLGFVSFILLFVCIAIFPYEQTEKIVVENQCVDQKTKVFSDFQWIAGILLLLDIFFAVIHFYQVARYARAQNELDSLKEGTKQLKESLEQQLQEAQQQEAQQKEGDRQAIKTMTKILREARLRREAKEEAERESRQERSNFNFLRNLSDAAMYGNTRNPEKVKPAIVLASEREVEIEKAVKSFPTTQTREQYVKGNRRKRKEFGPGGQI